MPLCIHCGVELDEGLAVCPLCGRHPETGDAEAASLSGAGEAPSHRGTGAGEESGLQGSPSAILKIHRKEQQRSLWELSAILAFSGMAICLIVDLLTGRGLRWAPLAAMHILMVWVILTLILFCRKRPLLLLGGILTAVLAALAATDLFAGGSGWFLPVGLPLTAAAFLALGTLWFLHVRVPLKGLNLPGSGLLLIAGFCIVTEIILDLFMTGSVHLRWSLITAISLLPVALILFFYHYRLKRGRRLETLFHV